MQNALRSWWHHVVRHRRATRLRPGRRRRPWLECLEDRMVFAIQATPLSFTGYQTAHAAGFLAAADHFDLYSLSLAGGDVVNAAVSAQAAGSGLEGALRVFDPNGRPIALDDREGGDPRLTFQAPTTGNYFVGVSSAGDDAYDPATPNSGHAGATTGLYALDLRRTPGAPLQADLAGSSFRLTVASAAYDDTVSGTFVVENRGGAATGGFVVQIVLSGADMVGASQVLTTVSVPGLAAGHALPPQGFTVRLPDLASATAAGLPASGPLSLGLRIDPAGAVSELNHYDQTGVHRGEDWETLTHVTPVTASGTNHSPASADVIGGMDSRLSGVLPAGQTDWYQLTVSTTERLTAEVAASGGSPLIPRLTLAGPNGQVLIQAVGGPIVQHLDPGTYYLSVSAVSGAGSYRLISEFVQASAPFQPVLGFTPWRMAVADIDGDGTPDLIATKLFSSTVEVQRGNGDGTFQPPQSYAVGKSVYSVAVADINGDGKPDLVLATYNYVCVLLGNGDGTFQPQRTFAAGPVPYSVAVADINGDGTPDLVVANAGAFFGVNGKISRNGNTVSVLQGNGDGTFQAPRSFAAGSHDPLWVAVADFNGDGKPDLVVPNSGTPDLPGNTVSVLLGNGDGTFQAPHSFAVGAWPTAVTAVDLNGDGKPDLVVANEQGAVSVLLGDSDGTFQPQQTLPDEGSPFSVAETDVNGDGKPDLVIAHVGGVSVQLGNGDGTFQLPRPVAGVVASGKYGWVPVAMADVNGDGKPDLVVATYTGVSVVPGNGDGTFQFPQAFATGSFPFSLATADLTGDGKPDVVVTSDGGVGALLGNGDGTLQPPRFSAAGSGPAGVVMADVNGDGKPDSIGVNSIYNTADVLLGNGDGSFQPPRTFAVGNRPQSVTAADLTGDGKLDLVVANFGDNDVSVLLGNGDGTFQPQRTFAAGKYAYAVAVADLNGDGKPDIIVANKSDNDVSVLLGNGDGTFQPQHTFAVGSAPEAVVVADLNGDGKPDLITANTYGSTVSVLLGNGDGTFQPQRTFATSSSPFSVVVADLNGDGKPDLVLPTYTGVSVLLGNGDGTFQPYRTFGVASGQLYPRSVAVADLNGDGKPDLVTIYTNYNRANVLLGNGDGTFTPITPTDGVRLRNTPYLADLDSDGISDSVVLDRSGQILFRKGLPGADNPFAPPVVLNPRRPARDLTVLHTATGPAIATADTSFDPTLSSANHFVYTVSLYTTAADGFVHRATAFSTTLLPTRIAAADLTGTGLDDLVVADSLDNSIQVAFQQPDGTFSPPITLPTGNDPSDLALVDVNGDGLIDIVATNQASGDVSVFFNDNTHSFAQSYRFRGGNGLYGLDTSGASPVINTVEQSVSLAAGDFTGAGRNDLVVINRGSESLSVLANDGNGGFVAAQSALTTSIGTGVGTQPGPVVAGDFNGDGNLDLAILMEDRAQVWIYTGDGHGPFRHTFSVAAGGTPTGLSLVRNPLTGFLDLLVGDPFGDVLHLQGKGDGTFQTAGSRVSLAVQDLGNGQTSVLVANQQTDRVTVQAAQRGSPQFIPVVTLADGTQSTLAPGAVQWAKLDRESPYFDALVLASGANAVLVYRGTGFDAAGRPTFAAPVSYAVGTNPVGLTIQDINGDGVPDLVVANQGSNDVSILFGSYNKAGDWVGIAGPRLAADGQGPIATTVRDLNRDSVPSLVSINSQSGTFTVLPGVGQGFFNDTDSRVLNVPGNPVLLSPSFFGTSSKGVVATADGRLIGFDLSRPDGGFHTLFTPPTGAEVDAVEALPDGHVVAALAGGAVIELAPSNGGLSMEQTFQSLGGIPTAPSDLAVLQGDSGTQVLVTNAGGDRLYVYAVPIPPESPVLPPEEPPSGPPVEVKLPSAEGHAGPTVEVTTTAAGSLTLVVTLTAEPLSDVPPAPAVKPAAEDAARAVEGGGGGGAEDTEQATASSWDVGPPPGKEGIDEQQRLRGIDLYQPPPNPDRTGPLSRQFDRPGRLDRLLLALTLDGSLPQVAAVPLAQPQAATEPADPWTALTEVVRAGDDDDVVPASADVERAADTVFALVTEALDVQPAPLLAWALTGLVWRPRAPRLPRLPTATVRKA